MDDYAIDPLLRNDLSFLFLIHMDAQGPIQLACVPTRIHACQVNRAKGADLDWSLQRIMELSRELDTLLEIAHAGLVSGPHLLLTLR